jgi:hypothetical protein
MANSGPIGISKGISSWSFQDNYVERVMDNAAYSSSHPDDTLVLAGPARKSSIKNASATTGVGSLLAIGMLQSVQFTQSKSTSPLMAIGSGRSFFVSGKASTQWTMGRLFVNGRNLLRVLYHNAKSANVNVEDFDDAPARNNNAKYFINLDSELFLVPFGLATLFRDKHHGAVGGFYAELCMISSYAVGFNAGQNLILENVTGLADRLLPFNDADELYTPGVSSATLDVVMGFTDPTQSDVTTENLDKAHVDELA